MYIKTINYDTSCSDEVDESIAIKDVIRHHLDEEVLSLPEILDKFDVPARAIIDDRPEDFFYIDLGQVTDQKVKDKWCQEKARIKEERYKAGIAEQYKTMLGGYMPNLA